MVALSGSLASLAAAQHGVVTAAALAGDGFGTNSIRRAVTAGRLVRIHRGVYRVATSPDTFEARCVAACLADPSIVVTGAAAARLWQFRHVPWPSRPVVLVGHDRRPLSGEVEVRRTNVLDAADVVTRRDGIRVASPVRTWFDCATVLSDDDFEMVTEWVLDHHATMPTLWRTFHRLGGRGRTGSARVRRVLGRRPDWQRPAGSRLELRVLKALERRGIQPLVRQHRIRLPSGVDIHVDGALLDIRWAIEVDHVTWHGGLGSIGHRNG